MTDPAPQALIERRHTALAKVPRDLLTDQRTTTLSPEARAVRVAAFILARSDSSQRIKGKADPGVGWLMAGGTTPAAALVEATGYPKATVNNALKELLADGALVRSDSRALGVVGWWSETARYSTRKVQEWRARQARAA